MNSSWSVVYISQNDLEIFMIIVSSLELIYLTNVNKWNVNVKCWRLIWSLVMLILNKCLRRLSLSGLPLLWVPLDVYELFPCCENFNTFNHVFLSGNLTTFKCPWGYQHSSDRIFQFNFLNCTNESAYFLQTWSQQWCHMVRN